MFKRTTLGGVLAATLAATTLGLTGPANATPVGNAPDANGYTLDADDTTFTAAAGDLVGVGSDTTQHALKLTADAYNSTSPTARIATWSATVPNGTSEATPNADDKIPVPDGLGGTTYISRPSGSGAGKNLLHGATNVPQIDFARASNSVADNASEVSDGLQQFPFAVDTLGVAVSNQTPTHAPANLTIDDIVNIYKGTYVHWNDIPGNSAGSSAAIAPMVPQAGSGTGKFFAAQLKTANGGVAVTYPASVATVQEHDPTPIEGNADAIAPFSIGRAGILTGAPVAIEPGWNAKRALYDVVRQADVNNADILAMFGPDGFLCSDPAYQLIKDAGFDQMARPAAGGDCGVASQTTESNFTTNVAPTPIATTTTVTGTSTTAGKATIKVAVTGADSTTARGKVDIAADGTTIASGLNLIGGQTTVVATNLPGSHSYTATYTHAADSLYTDSSATKSVITKAASKITESFPKATKVGKRAKGVVTVDLLSSATVPTGNVVVKLGSKVVGSGTLGSTGKVTLTLIKMAKGKHKLVASWAGNSYGLKSALTFYVTQK